MEFLNLAKKRYSCRKYSAQKVEAEKLDIILEAGRVAPTGANKQPQRLIVIRSEQALRKLNRACNTFNAPLAILVCSDKNSTWTRPFDGKKLTDIDASIVTDHMMLAAADVGLCSVWICYFDPEILREEFNIPDHLEPVNILAIGYNEEAPASPDRHRETRMPLEKTVFYDSF